MAKYGRLVMAMESEGAVGAGTDADDVAAAETATELEQNTSETTEVANSVAEVDTGINTAGEAAEGLTEVQDAVEEKVESGEGLTETEAEFAEMAVEAYCRMVGISAREQRIFPSMESFGGKSSRLRASKLALEGIGDTLKRIWEAIKAAIARAIEMVKSFFNGFIKSRESLEKHYNNLEQRLSDLPSNAKKDKDSFSTCASTFTNNGKADVNTVKMIIQNGGELLGWVPSAVDDMKTLVETGYEMAKNKSISKGDWGAKIGDAVAKIANSTKDGTNGKARSSKETGDKAVTIKECGAYVENQRMIVHYTAAKDDASPKLKITFEKSDMGSKEMASTIKAPSKEEMKDVLSDGRALLKALRDSDRTFGSNIKALEEMKRHTEEMIKLTGNINVASTTDASDQNDEKEKSRKMSVVVKDITSTLLDLSAKAPTMSFKACKGAADYVAAGIANMKVENKK